jgi:hypothetical protein
MIAYLATAILMLCTLPSGSYCGHLGPKPATRAREIATVLADAATSNGVDPYLLTALAFRESTFDRAAVSAEASFGLLQVNARGWGRDALHRCLVTPSDCLWWQAYAGARAMSHYQKLCGTAGRALTAYRTGRCAAPGPRALEVLETRRLIVAKFGGEQ